MRVRVLLVPPKILVANNIKALNRRLKVFSQFFIKIPILLMKVIDMSQAREIGYAIHQDEAEILTWQQCKDTHNHQQW